MDLASIQEAVVAWVTASLPATIPISWAGEPGTMQAKLPARIELDGPTMIVPIGQDWLMHEDASATEVTPTVVGNRELTIVVRAIGRSSAPNSRGQFWIERLRASLKKPSVLAAFQEANIAIVNAGPTAQYNAPNDNRVESIAAMEVRFATTISEADETGDAIASVKLTSHVSDTSGVELDVPPNYVDLQIPAPVTGPQLPAQSALLLQFEMRFDATATEWVDQVRGLQLKLAGFSFPVLPVLELDGGAFKGEPVFAYQNGVTGSFVTQPAAGFSPALYAAGTPAHWAFVYRMPGGGLEDTAILLGVSDVDFTSLLIAVDRPGGGFAAAVGDGDYVQNTAAVAAPSLSEVFLTSDGRLTVGTAGAADVVDTVVGASFPAAEVIFMGGGTFKLAGVWCWSRPLTTPERATLRTYATAVWGTP